MNDPLYKVVRGNLNTSESLGALQVGTRLNHHLAHGFPVTAEIMREALALLRDRWLDAARALLVPCKMDQHLLMLYLDWDELPNSLSATYVFDNRDAALMFKLSSL